MRESLIHRRPDMSRRSFRTKPDHRHDPRRFPIVVSIIVLIVVGDNEKTKIKNDKDRDLCCVLNYVAK